MKRIVYLLTLMVLVGCGGAFPQRGASNMPDPAVVAADEQAIRQGVAAWEASWNKHDMNEMATLLTEDAEWVNVKGMWWRGRADVRQAHVVYHDTIFKKTPYHSLAVAIRFLTRDVAVASVRWKKGSFIAPDGVTYPEAEDMMSMIWVKQSGKWLIALGHNTTIDPEVQQFNPIKK
jgi:uncharacterized protein (TIGR02246 family)